MRSFASENWSSIYATIKEYTLVPEPAIRFYVDAVLGCIHKKIPGDIVECGCWFAGASLAVCLAQQEIYGRIVKPVWLLDKFCGFEEPGPKDGNYLSYCQNISKSWDSDLSAEAKGFFENSSAKSAELSPGAVESIFMNHGFIAGKDIIVVPGWVKDTIPPLIHRLQPSGLSILRVDVDLYEATKQCLQLEPLVVDHGLVMVDDYYHFDGCALAVHECLSVPKNSYKIRSMPGQGIFWEKRKPKSFEYIFEWPYEEKII